MGDYLSLAKRAASADDLRYLQGRVQNLERRMDKADRESAKQKSNRQSWHLTFWFGLWFVSWGFILVMFMLAASA